MIHDFSEVEEIRARLGEAGITSVFVPGGDADPVGVYPDSFSLLEDLNRLEKPFTHVGIAGYPESHPKIHDDLTVQAMWDKRRHATHIVSNLTFDAGAVKTWVERMRARGITQPVLLGLPGPIDRAKLLSMATKIGVGESTRFLSKNAGFFAKLAAPGGWTGQKFLEEVATTAMKPESLIEGLHVFTFNQIAATEAWRQELLARSLSRRTSDAGTEAVGERSPSGRRRYRSRPLEAAVARGYDGEREAESSSGVLGEGTQLGGLVLGQPDDAGVVAEVLVAQLRPPVQAELGLDGARERLHQEVGEQVGAGLVGEERLDPAGPGVHVVAVQPLEPPQPEPLADLVEGAVGAAVGVPHHHGVVRRSKRLGQPGDLTGDLLRLVVQQRRKRVYVDRPAVLLDDPASRLGDRATRDQCRPRGRRGGRRTGR